MPGVDVVGDILDTDVLQQAGLAEARVVVLACENDSAALLAATVIRDFAPNLPIIACAALKENVERIQHGGADFALSISQVSGQILAHHILGEIVSQQTYIKLVKQKAAWLAGRHPLDTDIASGSHCNIVAIGRNGDTVLDIADDYVLEENDDIFVCGTADALNQFKATTSSDL